jgi:hypothetical protein
LCGPFAIHSLNGKRTYISLNRAEFFRLTEATKKKYKEGKKKKKETTGMTNADQGENNN